MKTIISGRFRTLLPLVVIGLTILLVGCAFNKQNVGINKSSMQSQRGWAELRYVESLTNIRGDRSIKSKIVGRLKAGQKVKADFMEDGWYAVFPADEVDLYEENALGFVHAPLLKPVVKEWGEMKYVHSLTNMRKARSTSSKIVGRLKAGQKVKVDHLEDEWYAVFNMDETDRSEKNALGYVFGPLLKENPPEL